MAVVEERTHGSGGGGWGTGTSKAVAGRPSKVLAGGVGGPTFTCR